MKMSPWGQREGRPPEHKPNKKKNPEEKKTLMSPNKCVDFECYSLFSPLVLPDKSKQVIT